MRLSIVHATAIALVLTGAALLFPGGAMAVAAAPSATPAATMVSIEPTGSGGGSQFTFYAGLSTGHVYFLAGDTAGDASATVAINDHNATRDGLVNPVWTAKANFGLGTTNSSAIWGISYLIPVNLTFGGLWNITISATTGGFASTNFTVLTYRLALYPTPSSTLPAHNASISYISYFNANHAIYAHATQVLVTGYYYASGTTYTKFPSSPKLLGSAGTGWYNFTVPNDASGGLFFSFWANTTSGGGNTSAGSFTEISVGVLGVPYVSLSSCPSGCTTTSFVAGSPVYVTVYDPIAGGASGPAVGVNIGIKFEHGATFVTPPGNPPASLVTNYQGLVSFTFIASYAVFPAGAQNSVVVTVTDPLDPADTSQTGTAYFTTYNATLHPTLQATWSSSEFFSGESATVNWAIGGENASVTAGWVGDFWAVELSGTIGYAFEGPLAAGSTSGSFSVVIPASYVGPLVAMVVVNNATESLQTTATADVEAGAVVLSANEISYLPGDTITVSVGTQGNALTGATLWGTVVDSSDNWVFNGAVTGGSITIHVPSPSPPTGYTVTVVAQSATQGTIANSTLRLELANGIDLTLGVTSSSNYVDDSFQPGETVTVSYQFTTRGTAVLPKTFVIYLSPYSTDYTDHDAQIVQASGASGTFSYKIPDDAANGVLFIYAEADLGGSGCTTNCYTYGYLAITVSSNPSSLSYQFAGSGFTLGELLLIVVIVVVAIVGFILWRRRSRPVMMRPETPGGSPPVPGMPPK